MISTLIHIEDLSVSYGQERILEGINLSLNPGKIACILGNNGSGKSTLINTVYGILPAIEGKISFMGKEITRLSVLERINLGIGYLPQDNSLFKRLKVKDHIKLAASVNINQNEETVFSIIRTYFKGFENLENKTAGLLSGGERRKLGLAVLVAQGADKLWLLDEPSASVDKKGLDEIYEYISFFKNEKKIAFFLVEQNRNFGTDNADVILEL